MNKLEDVIQKLLDSQEKLGIEFNQPADDASIAAFNTAFKLTLPDELVRLYKFTNGFATLDALFRITPLDECIRELMQYDNGVRGSEFVFAEYMIYSDTWKVRLKPNNPELYDIINQNHETEAAVILTNSVADFLNRYLEGGGVFGDEGLYKWFEERKALGY